MKNDTSDVQSVPKTSGTSGTSVGIAITSLIHQILKKDGMFWKIHQKCYMIGTIISNIIGKINVNDCEK